MTIKTRPEKSVYPFYVPENRREKFDDIVSDAAQAGIGIGRYTLDYIIRLEKENKELKEMIEMLKGGRS